MFNEKYWQDKIDRQSRAQEPFSLRAMSFLRGFFHTEPPERKQHDEKEAKRHSRSMKERRMRHIRHQSMMRNHA